MKLNINDIEGSIAKQDERYVVKDNSYLNKLVVSSTLLNPGYSTSGHRHEGQEEVYFFVEGTGRIELDDVSYRVKPGDMVLIEDGVFHRVYADNTSSMYFVCVFDGERKHK